MSITVDWRSVTVGGFHSSNAVPTIFPDRRPFAGARE